MARSTNAARHLGFNSIGLRSLKPTHAARPALIGPTIASLDRRNTQEDSNATMPEARMSHAVRNEAQAELRGLHGLLRPSGFVLLYCSGEYGERNQFSQEPSSDAIPRYGWDAWRPTLVIRCRG